MPATLRWTGRQGIFPLAYRGWAVAGYNGDGDRATQPIHEDDFIIDPSTLPTADADAYGVQRSQLQPAEGGQVVRLPAVGAAGFHPRPADADHIRRLGRQPRQPRRVRRPASVLAAGRRHRQPEHGRHRRVGPRRQPRSASPRPAPSWRSAWARWGPPSASRPASGWSTTWT